MSPGNDGLPEVIHLPLGSRHDAFALLLLHEGRALYPPGGLRALRGFVREAGGWLAAAQAADERWGLLVFDAEQQDCAWRVPPQWDNAFNPAEASVRFRQHGLWGCCDTHGRSLIAPRYANMRPFAGGRAAVREDENDGPWYWIDAQGHRAGSETFAELFSLDAQGYARARNHDGRAGFSDGEGRWRIAPRFQHLWPFGPGNTAPASEDGEHWGLIDRAGAWVLAPCHRHIAAFNANGLAHFCPHGSLWDIAYGYLDARGSVVIAPAAHIAEVMIGGIAAAHYDGSRYVRADGSALPAPALSFGSAFRAGGGPAIARNAEEPAAWGLLHSDGRFVPAPAGLIEPWTDWEALIPDPLPGSACTPFITADRGIAWLHPTQGVLWRVRYAGGGVTLHDADGRTLWAGASADDYGGPQRFFTAPAEDNLEGMRAVAEAPSLAETLLAQADQRLREYAAGQQLARGDAGDDCDGDDEDDTDADDAGDEDEQQSRTQLRRRVFRAYLSDELAGPYAFLADVYAAQARQIHAAIHAVLAAHFGPVEDAPSELPQPWRYQTQQAPAWRVGDRLLALYHYHDSGDGDAWWEVWLHVGPAGEALRQATESRAAGAA